MNQLKLQKKKLQSCVYIAFEFRVLQYMDIALNLKQFTFDASTNLLPPFLQAGWYKESLC